MSISSALINATTGLKANSRLVGNVSNNVSNALTEGFGRRSTELSSTVLGGYGSGVRIISTNRAESVYLTAERRGADSSLGASDVLSTAYERMLEKLGEPGADGSFGKAVHQLESRLITLAASPQSAVEQGAVLSAAKSLTGTLNAMSHENDRIRTDAENEIVRQVDQVNSSLHEIEDLNDRIQYGKFHGSDVNGLLDQRDRVLDQIAKIIPVSVVKRDLGQISVYSANGAALLNPSVSELSFDATNGGVLAQMSPGLPLNYLMQDQGLSTGLTTIPAGTGSGFMDGGSLGALFELRDTIVPEYGAEIDAWANDLVERMRDLMPAGFLDASGDGLFVDGTGAGTTIGLAGRLEVNAAVDPSNGGELWRLRDGLSAVAPGNDGFGDYVIAMSDAMTEVRPAAAFAKQSANGNAAAFAAGISSVFSGLASRADQDLSFMSGLQATLAENEINEIGVDTDTELEMLMVVEQAYAANARVLTVLDELMQLLLGV